MTGVMNIRIQVYANQARKAVQDVEKDLSKLSIAQGAGAAASGRHSGAMRTQMRNLTSFGNQLQWTGRQLQYNWTLPILAAAAAGVHFQMENEKAMTRLKKVYADPGFAHTTAELKSLEKAFETLSETYGVAQAEVIGIAADWAAAGSSGLALAKQTELTMKTMVLGEMEAAEATQALIAIQAQYNQSSDELADTIYRLNNVENQTGTKMADLVVSMSRAAGVARAAGIDVAHLAAMTAALVPAAGTASQAGNALKTIVSRLLSPTAEASDLLHEMGIATDDMAWKGANATSRIELLAGKFFDLSDSQQAVVSATLASRYQINKFEVLMEAIAQKGNAAGEGMSYYWKALDAATNRTEYLDQVTRELDAVLDSSPRRWEKIKVVMSNALANVVQPMLPALMAIGGQIAMLTKHLSELNPVTLKWIGLGLAMLVILPMTVRYVGSLITLFATFGRALIFLLAPLGLLVRGLRLLAFTSVVATMVGWLGTALVALGGAVWVVASALAAFSKYLLVLPGLLALMGKAVMVFSFLAATFGPGLIVAGWTAMTTALAAVWAVILPALLVAWRAFSITAVVIAAEMGSAIRLAWAVMLLGLEKLLFVFTATAASIWRLLGLTMAVGLKGPLSIALAIAAGFGNAFAGILGNLRLFYLHTIAAMQILGMGLWASMWAALGAISVAGGGTLATIIATVQRSIIFLWAATTGAIAAIWAALGPILSRIWIMVSVSLSVIMAQTSAGLLILWRTLMLAFEAALIGFATAAGIIWRTIPLIMAAGIRGPWAFILGLTANFMVAMQTIFAAGWVAIQHIIVAGAAVAGIVWRNAMVLMTLITAAGGAAMNLVWLAITRMWAMRTAMITAITFLWGNVIVPIMMTIGRALMAALASPWTWVALAVVAILYGLRDKIVVAWKGIVNWLSSAADAVVDRVVGAFNLLPQGIQNALRAVVKMIRDAAMAVYEWFSYLNPFARHSPSLVENVTRGMAAVNSQFGTLTQIKRPIDAAYASIARFKAAMGALGDNLEFAKDRELIAEVSPGALASFDNLTRTLVATRAHADQLNAAVKNQERVVKVWQQRLDAANEALEDQRDILNQLQDVADGYGDQISKLNEEIDTLASAPLSGMGAMEDALFANEMAQKRLRLEMLKAGEQGGQSIDDIRSKIASMAGEMETLTGTREDLRSMGAGSEILDHYDAQIEALAAQKKALERAEAPVNEMQKQLEELQRQAEIMDLEKALQFDPLTRAIDRAANAMDEMPFDAIIGKIRANQSAIDQLEPAYNAATAAVEAQEAAVIRAQAAVDAIQASYDAEADKLAVLRDLYQEVADAVRDMEGALSDASGAANAVKEGGEGYISPALQNFRDAAGGDFADVGGSGIVGREGGMGDQSAMIDDWAAKLAESAGDMFGEFDMWQPLRDMWDKFVAWWDRVIGPWITAAGDFFDHMFDGVDIFSGLRGKGDEVGGFFSGLWDAIVEVVSTVWDFGKLIWDFLGPDVITTLDLIWGFFVDMWENLKTIFADAKEMASPLIDALVNLWNIVKVPLGLTAAAIVGLVEIAWSLFNGVLGPVLDWISGLFMNVWQVVKGLLDMFIGLFTLDFDRFFDGLGDALKGLWGIVWDTLVSLGDLILSALGGLVSGIWDAMFYIGEMIWDGLDAGLNAIGLGWLTDIIGGIIDFVKDLFGIASPSTVFAEIGGWLMDGLVNGITTGVTAVWDFFVALPGKVLGWIGDAAVWLFQAGVDALGGLLRGLITMSVQVGIWLVSLPFTIIGWLWDAAVWLFQTGKDVIGGLLGGLIEALVDVGTWLLGLPVSFLTWVGESGGWLYEKGKDVIGGLAQGMYDKGQDIADWLIALPGKVKEWAGDTTTWLLQKGEDIITGLINGIKKKAEEVTTWFTELPGKIETWVGDTITFLYDDGFDLLTGFIQGIIDKVPEIIQWFQDLPGKIQEWIGDTATYLIDNGGELISGFVQGIIDNAPAVAKGIGIILLVILAAMFAVPVMLIVMGGALIIGFVKGIAEAISTHLGPKLTEFKEFLGRKVQEAVDWVQGKWDAFWTMIRTAAQNGITWVQEKFQGFKDKISEIFQSIKDKIGEIWDGLLEKVKTPIRVVFTWVNGNMIDPINSLLKKFPGDLKIPSLPALREGGQVRGPGTGTSDSILGVNRKGVPTSLVSDGEFVVNAKSTRENLGLLQALNSGNLPRFRDGGLFGNIGNAASWAWDKAGNAASWVGEKVGDLVAKGGRFAAEQLLKPLRDAAKGLVPGDGIFPTTLRGSIDKLYEAVAGKGDEHDKQMASLQGGTFPGTGKRTPNGVGGLGPQALAARNFVSQTYGISNIGGYAYRNVAGTGTLSDHATGHAIDVMIANYKTPAGIAKGNQVASYFVQNPNAYGTKYVIWRDQINQGRGWQAYGHPGGGRSDTLQHRDHVHVSLFDQGGMMSGLGVNMTGKPERVLSPRQTMAFEKLVTFLDRDGVPSVAVLEAAIFRATAKAQAASTIGHQTVIQHQGDNNVTVNFYGDLSFPNITDGEDADVFLQNLGDLAGGGRR